MRVLLLAALCVVAASAETFDFESTTPGFYSSLAVTNGGVTLTVTPEGFPNGSVDITNPGVALLGSRSLIGTQANGSLPSDQFAPVRFSFSAPVSSITFAFGDAGGDDDSPILISGYDAGNNLLGTLNGTYPAGDSSGATLSGSFADASYFVLTSGPHTSGSNSDSIFWEVPEVTFDTSSAPEPGTFLLGAALLGVAGVFRARVARRVH